MITLSVNINKIALIRNSRGHNFPNLVSIATELIHCGAEGITIHPRPDERHIRYQDAYDLKKNLPVDIDLNIEGYPSEKFLNMVCEVEPAQCTLVPDAADAMTSNAGWNCRQQENLLSKAVKRLQEKGIRSSLFVEAGSDMQSASATGANRIELYTENYANAYSTSQRDEIFAQYAKSAENAHQYGLGINAGHDLNLANLTYFAKLPYLCEISIGHALIVDMLHFGMTETIKRYLEQLILC